MNNQQVTNKKTHYYNIPSFEKESMPRFNSQDIIRRFMQIKTPMMSSISYQVTSAFNSLKYNYKTEVADMYHKDIEAWIEYITYQGTRHDFSPSSEDVSQLCKTCEFIGSHPELIETIFKERYSYFIGCSLIAIQSSILFAEQFKNKYRGYISDLEGISSFDRDRVFWLYDEKTKTPISYILLNGSFNKTSTWKTALEPLYKMQVKQCKFICRSPKLSDEVKSFLRSVNFSSYIYSENVLSANIQNNIDSIINNLNWSNALFINPSILCSKTILNENREHLFVFQNREQQVKESIAFIENIIKDNKNIIDGINTNNIKTIEVDKDYSSKKYGDSTVEYFNSTEIFNIGEYLTLIEEKYPVNEWREYNPYYNPHEANRSYGSYQFGWHPFNKEQFNNTKIEIRSKICLNQKVSKHCSLLSSSAYISNIDHDPNELYRVIQSFKDPLDTDRGIFSKINDDIEYYRKNFKKYYFPFNNFFLNPLDLFKGELFLLFLSICLKHQIEIVLSLIQNELKNRVCIDDGIDATEYQIDDYANSISKIDYFLRRCNRLAYKYALGSIPDIIFCFIGLESFDEYSESHWSHWDRDFGYDNFTNLEWLKDIETPNNNNHDQEQFESDISEDLDIPF